VFQPRFAPRGFLGPPRGRCVFSITKLTYAKKQTTAVTTALSLSAFQRETVENPTQRSKTRTHCKHYCRQELSRVPRDVPALSIETPGDSGHVFQRNQVDPRLINVRAGEYMPLWKMLPNATWKTTTH